MGIIKRILSGVLLVAVIIVAANFIAANQAPTKLSLFYWETVSLPQYVVLAIAFFIGVLIATLWFAQDLLRKSMKINRLERELRRYEPTQSVSRIE